MSINLGYKNLKENNKRKIEKEKKVNVLKIRTT